MKCLPLHPAGLGNARHASGSRGAGRSASQLRAWLAAGLMLCSGLTPALAQTQPANAEYDVVLLQGRVLDPESGLDAVRNIGINGGRIAIVTEAPLRGRKQIDASAMVVGPGFIDLHSHAINVPSNWMQAFDGVTTALELEAGSLPIAQAYERSAAARLPLHYGFSVSWAMARLQVADGVQATANYEEATRQFGRPNWSQLLKPGQSAQVVELMERGLREGGLGIGLVPGYAPSSNREEYLAAGSLAARFGVPTFTHLRYKNDFEPQGVMEAVLELLGVAAATGAHMHLCHVNSSALRKVGLALSALDNAQKSRIKVTTEAYPWGAGSTVIGAPFLRPESLDQLGVASSAITYLKTGERPATPERLAQIQRDDPGGLAVVHYLDESKPEEMKFIDEAVLFRDVMIASDAQPFTVGGRHITTETWPIDPSAYSHPRSVATFMRVLELYVKGQQSMPLIDLFRRGSLLPANLVATAAAEARLKGRIQPGMDADIVVIDLAQAAARASYLDPRQPSTGVRHLLVAGQFVIENGNLNREARPGRPIRAPIR